ncbi:glycoside hydrolase family 92 protein [Phyllosticta citricarpa]|uniref:Glycoside hydrolase family 92 protein n=2 Tax=Phyllosticta TaxID=121621 RepID=A0ABR1MI79_9PEZI
MNGSMGLKTVTQLLLVALTVLPCSAQLTEADNLQYVNQLIGSLNGGNVFVGATRPFGMAKACPDTDSQLNQAGFVSDGSNVTGFSATHDSGTGGSASLGLFAFFPEPGCPQDDINNCKFPKKARKLKYRNDTVRASPNFFSVQLENGVTVDMTSAVHASLFRFKYPQPDASINARYPMLLLDLTDLQDSRGDNGTIRVDGSTGRMTGNARFNASFGQGSYVAYFCADYRSGGIHDNGIFVNSRASADVKDLTISKGINGYPLPGGGFTRFSQSGEVLARIGLSLISENQACQSAEREIPDFDFQTTQNQGVDEWRAKLSPISASTNGVNRDLLVNFFSGIYRTFVNPQDYTGENPLWQSDEPYFDSFYCLWDQFRSQLPFLTLVDPSQVERMIRSLIDTYRYIGWLPECRMTLTKGFTQGGSNADVVLTDGFLKGLTSGINWDDGYKAIVKDAEKEPYDWCCQGRGGLDSWKRLGYIPVEDFDYKGFGSFTRSISRTLEYAHNDFCISEFARAAGGRDIDVTKYQDRSGNWRNLFKNTQTSNFGNGSNTGFTGFYQPRYLNGTFGFQDPLACSLVDPVQGRPCSLQVNSVESYESSIWEYMFYVPHDQATLISTLGGPAEYVRRLNYLHDQNITYIGNEPSFLTVYQYHYAGRPAESARRVHYYIPRSFGITYDGLPGNDDSGTLGAYVALCMMGTLVIPGQNVYLITPPFFESVNITNPTTNRTATIRNINFDPSYEAIYIQNATLDGQPYTKNWIDHSFFTEGKELVLTLGRTESTWGTSVEDLPPSLGSYDFRPKARRRGSSGGSPIQPRAPYGMDFIGKGGVMDHGSGH